MSKGNSRTKRQRSGTSERRDKPKPKKRTMAEDMETFEDAVEIPEMPDPEHFKEEVWKLLHSIKNEVISNKESIKDIKQDITAINGRIDDVEERTDEEYEDMLEEIHLIKSMTIRQQTELDQTIERQELIHVSLLENNLLFHNVEESDREDCMKKVREACIKLAGEGAVTMAIEKANRLGSPREDSKFPRLMSVKFANQADVGKLLKASYDKVYDVKNLRVTRQYPREMAEKRRELGRIMAREKINNPDIEAKIKNGRLYLNNQVYREPLPPPPRITSLKLTEPDKADLDIHKPEVGFVVREGACSFRAMMVPIKSLNDVRGFYKKAMLDAHCVVATHNICIARWKGPNDDQHEVYQDDGEYGASQHLLNHIRAKNVNNRAYIISRHYGGRHLGKVRFTRMTEAIDTIE